MTTHEMVAALSVAMQYLAVRCANYSVLIDTEMALGKFADLLGTRCRNSPPLRLYRLPPKRYTPCCLILDRFRWLIGRVSLLQLPVNPFQLLERGCGYRRVQRCLRRYLCYLADGADRHPFSLESLVQFVFQASRYTRALRLLRL
jgi:hypothetical protein